MRQDYTTLGWSDLRSIGKSDNANRWYPESEFAKEYIYEMGIRSPSRSWPHSYAKAVMTKKFSKWMIKNHPVEAEKLGLKVIQGESK